MSADLIICFGFPQAGLILLCLGCAIFGITEVPTDGVEFDTGDFGGESNGESVVSPTPDVPSGANYTPPRQTEESPAERDPEAGQPMEAEESGAKDAQPEISPTAAAAPTSAKVDLLDDIEAGQTQRSNNGTIHELD